MYTRRVRAPVPEPLSTGGSCPIGAVVKTGDSCLFRPGMQPIARNPRQGVGSGARSGVDVEPAADGLDALAAGSQADRTGGKRLGQAPGRVAGAVVGHAEDDLLGLQVHADVD